MDSNARALALESADPPPEPAAVLRLAGTILSFAYARGEPREGQEWLEAALVADTTAPPRIRIDAMFTASALAQVQGDFARSAALSEEGLVFAQAQGYAFGQARAHIALGITAEWQGDLDGDARALDLVAIFR